MPIRTRVILIVFALSMFVAAPALAGGPRTITGGYVGCVTLRDLDEMERAIADQDEDHARALGHVCLRLRHVRYWVVYEDWELQRAQIRLDQGDGSIVLWVPIEATFK